MAGVETPEQRAGFHSVILQHVGYRLAKIITLWQHCSICAPERDVIVGNRSAPRCVCRYKHKSSTTGHISVVDTPKGNIALINVWSHITLLVEEMEENTTPGERGLRARWESIRLIKHRR